MRNATAEVIPQAVLEINGKQVSNTTSYTDHVIVPELDGRFSLFLTTTDPRDIDAVPDGFVRDFTIVQKINDVRYPNQFFEAVNRKLPKGGYYTGCAEVSERLKQRILSRYPLWISWPYYVGVFVYKRVLPKLKLTRKLFLALTKGHNQAFSTAEVLGRLVYCGFEIVDHQVVGDELYYVVEKVGPPRYDEKPSYGLIFKMERIGRGGRMIYVYKLRTMHPYAKFLQSYMYAKNDLHPKGKFKDDFRVATWGKFLRRRFIDELPMLLNWLKREVKLVGVRPLSEHYANLYPEDFLEKRLRYKPGLIPPLYVDLPEGFDEIVKSEASYLTAYDEHPLKTDAQYFFRALRNIIFKGARSQ